MGDPRTLDYSRTNAASVQRAASVSRPGADGTIVIHVRYPDNLRWGIAIGCGVPAVVTVVLGGVAVRYGGWWGFPIAALVIAAVLAFVLSTLLDVFSEHEWTVAADGITMLRVGLWGGRHVRRLPRLAIRDVRIRFRRNSKTGGSSSELVLQPPRWWQFRRAFFTSLGGNELAVIADAVREGLGFPPVSWPSGRVIQSAVHAGRA
jgi:hypothetical protein